MVAARISDSDGMVTQHFSSLICASRPHGELNPTVNANEVACTIHVARSLDPEELVLAYDRIGIVKRLKRAPRSHTEPWQADTPSGIIFALDTSTPLEKHAEHLMLLNKSRPSTEWPDMIVILMRGTINYAVQFAGDKMGGDFVLPNEAYFPVMPMYGHVFAGSLGLWSFNNNVCLAFYAVTCFQPPNQVARNERGILKAVSPYG